MSLGVGSVLGVSILGLCLLVISAWLGRRDLQERARRDEQTPNRTQSHERRGAVSSSGESSLSPPGLE